MKQKRLPLILTLILMLATPSSGYALETAPVGLTAFAISPSPV